MEILVSKADLGALGKKVPDFLKVTLQIEPFVKKGYPTLINAFISIILSQQISTAAFTAQLRKIPKSVREDPGLLYDFLTREDCPLKVSKTKTAALLAITEDLKKGVLSDKSLYQLDPSSRREVLISYKGIGPWSCDMLDLLYFGEQDIFAVSDFGVRAGLAKILGVTQEELKKDLLNRYCRMVSPMGSKASALMWRVNKLVEDKTLVL